MADDNYAHGPDDAAAGAGDGYDGGLASASPSYALAR